MYNYKPVTLFPPHLYKLLNFSCLKTITSSQHYTCSFLFIFHPVTSCSDTATVVAAVGVTGVESRLWISDMLNFFFITLPNESSANTVNSSDVGERDLISECLSLKTVGGRSVRNSQWWNTTPSGTLRNSTRRRPARLSINELKKRQQ